MATTPAGTLPDTSGIDKNCLITNNSGIDIIAISGFNSSTSTGTTQLLYEQTLTLLKDVNGQSVIQSGAQGSVVLDQYYTDEDGTVNYDEVYNVIIAKSDNLYPVESDSVFINDDEVSYPPLVTSTDGYANMQLTEKFQQVISAFPTSNLAKGYQNAISGATTNGTSGNDIDSRIAAFFSTTDDYKTVTVNSLAAINTYHSQFPFVWALYTSFNTYYFYSTDGSTMTYQGSLVVSTPSSVPANTDKSLPGFSFQFTDADGNTKSLYYQDGQFVDQLDNDTPNICLQGQFVLKSQFTKKSTDNSLMPTLIGVINDNKVFSLDEKQTSPDNWSGTYSMLHPHNVMQFLQLLLTGSGLLMGVVFAVDQLLRLKNLFFKAKVENKGVEPSSGEVQAIKQQIADSNAAAEERYQKLLDKFNEGIEVVTNLADGTEKLQKQMIDQANEASEDSLTTGKTAAESEFRNVSEYGMNPQMEETFVEIKSITMTPPASDPDGSIFSAALAKDASLLQKVKGELAVEKANVEGQMTSDVVNTTEKLEAEVTESEEEDEEENNEASGEELGEVPTLDRGTAE